MLVECCLVECWLCVVVAFIVCPSSVGTVLRVSAARGGRLTRQGVESAGGEEVSVEVDVHVAEEEQNVASLPGSGPQVQTPAPGELLKIVLPIKSKRKCWQRNEYDNV